MIIVCRSKVFQRIRLAKIQGDTFYLPIWFTHMWKMLHWYNRKHWTVLRCCCSLGWWMKGNAEFKPRREQFDETEEKNRYSHSGRFVTGPPWVVSVTLCSQRKCWPQRCQTSADGGRTSRKQDPRQCHFNSFPLQIPLFTPQSIQVVFWIYTLSAIKLRRVLLDASLDVFQTAVSLFTWPKAKRRSFVLTGFIAVLVLRLQLRARRW